MSRITLLVFSKIILANAVGFAVLFWPWSSLIFTFQDLFFTFLFFSSLLPVPGFDLEAPLSWLGPCRLSGISLATGTSSEGSRLKEQRAVARGGDAFSVGKNGAELVAGLLPEVRQPAALPHFFLIAACRGIGG